MGRTIAIRAFGEGMLAATPCGVLRSATAVRGTQHTFAGLVGSADPASTTTLPRRTP